MDDVLAAKAAIIERCLRRVSEEYASDPRRLENYSHQDAIILNLERACQACIDMSMHIVAREHLGVPQSSAEAFELLSRAGKIPADLAASLKAMTGFRNIAVHEYQNLRLDILQRIIEHGGNDFSKFCSSLGFKIKLP